MKCPTCKKKHDRRKTYAPYCSEECFYKMSYEKEIIELRNADLIKAVTELPEWDLENVSAALISKKEVLELIKGGKG